MREFDPNYIHSSLAVVNYCHSSATVVAAGALGNDFIKFFDFETGKCLSEFKMQDDDELMSSILNDEDSFSSTSTSDESNLRRDLLSNEAAGDSLADAAIDTEVIYSMTALDHYPFLAVGTSDGKVSVYGTMQAHPRIKQSCVLRFNNTPPPNATYKGENEQEYPLLHMPRKEDDLYRTREVGHRLSLRRRSTLGFEEDSDPTWVTKPRWVQFMQESS